MRRRSGLAVAPVEHITEHGSPGRNYYVSYQAARCPHCKALVAVGPSLDDHIFFCGKIPEKPLINGVGSVPHPFLLGNESISVRYDKAAGSPSKRVGVTSSVPVGWKVPP